MQIYQCDSLERAAFFIANDIEPIGSTRLGSGLTAWAFTWSEQLEQLIADYAQGNGAAGIVRRTFASRRKLLREAAPQR